MDEIDRVALTAPGAQTGLRRRLSAWIFQPRGCEAGEVFLNQRRVFIFPTRYGFFFAFSLLAFLAASINYDLALGFVLTFFLASAGLVGMLHTFRNQVHLRLRPHKADPVFAGSRAAFEITLNNQRVDERAAIWLKTRHSAAAVDVPPESSHAMVLAVPTERRGWLAAPRITIDTRYPLGLFRAWSYWQPDLQCLVYPAPASSRLDFPAAPNGNGEGVPHGAGTDDFVGLREYRPGDSPRHIAWKAAARSLATGAPLPAKAFGGNAAAEITFDLDDFAAAMELEARLSQLTRWVLDADAMHLVYALKLGSRILEPGAGEAHRMACLKALALHQPVPGNP